MKAKRKQTPTLAWPRRAWPRVMRVLRAPHDDRHFETLYQGPHYALHLYEYAATMRLGDREVSLEPADVTITPPNTPARYHVPERGYHLVVHYQLAPKPGPEATEARTRAWRDDGDEKDERREDEQGLVTLPLHLRLGLRASMLQRRVMEMISLRAQASGDAVGAVALSSSLQAALLWLALQTRGGSDVEGGGNRADRAVQRAVDLLERRLDRPLSVPDLADEVELSQNYLARQFRGRVGMTMQHYQLTRRIELAAQLLETTDLPIARIAQRVGMPDAHHFNKQFRRLTGQSPAAARLQA